MPGVFGDALRMGGTVSRGMAGIFCLPELRVTAGDTRPLECDHRDDDCDPGAGWIYLVVPGISAAPHDWPGAGAGLRGGVPHLHVGGLRESVSQCWPQGCGHYICDVGVPRKIKLWITEEC